METDGSAQDATEGHAYRAKLMDAFGRIETTVALTAATDNEALQQVAGLARSYYVELWDGGRLVLRVPQEGQPQGSPEE